jgi:hypothetical protein
MRWVFDDRVVLFMSWRAAEFFGASWIMAVARGCGTRGSGAP